MKITSFLLIIIAFNFSYSQTYEAQYRFEINIDHFKKAKKKNIQEGKDPVLVNKAFSIYLNSRPIKARLVFDGERSYYHVIKDMSIDKDSGIPNPIKLLAGNRKQYYQQQNQDSVLIHYKGSNLEISEFLINSSYEPIDLKTETKTIGKYRCFLAELQFSARQTLKLWYTPDIPVPVNILNYAALPGLLIKIESDIYDADLISLKQVNAEELKQPPQDVSQITRSQYKKMMNDVNPFKNE